GDELTGRTVAQRAVGVNLVVVRQPGWKLAQHGLGVRNRGDANVVALQGAHERLSHAVRLWALERGRAGHQPDVPGEVAGLPGEVAAAVVGQPLDLDGQAVDPSEPVFDGGHHQVAHVLARDAAGGCHEANNLPVAAVEGEGHAHALTVVAADLQAVRAPAGVARVHGNAPLVPALLAAGVALE